MPSLGWLFYLLIPAFILAHLFVSPYTKVEESFNMQAIHDILIHGIPSKNFDQFFTANYDHVAFPGSVPRTFTGALLISGLSRPWVGWLSEVAQMQLLVRGILGLLNAFALMAFGRSVQRAFGTNAGIWYTIFQASQFHVIYYASRTLPNMYAFVFSNLALGRLLNAHALPGNTPYVSSSHRLSLYLLTISGVIFRSELAILVGTITIYLFVTQKISVLHVVVPAGLAGLLGGLACTVLLDSFFWQSFPLWPEWIAFYFNTIQGHSADWGVSPWYYYFGNALPRLLMNPATYLLCIPVAVLNVSTRKASLDLLIPLLGFVGLYSFLPHKEWRFIIYVIPGLTSVAAAGASWIWTRRGKSIVYTALSLALAGSVLLSFAASTMILGISSLNYPGGEALHILHNQLKHPAKSHFDVYFDNLACQTGVTRFLESHQGSQTMLDVLESQVSGQRGIWTYDKTEDPTSLLDPMFWIKFDYVLAEKPEKVIGSWAVVHVVYGFGGVRVLKPGQESGSAVEPLHEASSKTVVKKHWTDKVAGVWHYIEELIRDRYFRGYWVEIKMDPKVRILQNLMK